MREALQPQECEGTIVVHEDASCTCTEGDCGASGSRFGTLTSHSWFLACRAALGDNCPICQPVRLRLAQPGG